jgi:hypothetical protein
MPAFHSFRANLAAANFPFISGFQGRTIILAQFDQNFNRYVNSAADTDKDYGIPQVFYMHNCMPTGQGFQSIGYENVSAAMVPPVTDFDSAFTLRDGDENKAIFVPASGNNYVFTGNTNLWASASPLPTGSFPANGLVTIANIHQRTFVFYENIGAFEYDFTTKLFNAVTLGGLSVSNIRGILSSTGYTLAFDDNTIYWSSSTDEVDFVPSLVTGAGSQIPNDIKGAIVTVLPVASGYVIYTTKNAVFATYSGNIRFPWVFKEVSNSAGIKLPENVSYGANLSFHYALTTVGLMKVDRVGAEMLFPEVTDFLAAKVFEDCDESILAFSTIFTTSQLRTKLAFIGSRYLVISYGVASLTHAIVYDASYKRWGKLKINHVDCFEWPAPNFFGTRTYAQLTPNTYADLSGTTYAQLSTQQSNTSEPKKDIVFLQQDGTMQRVNFDLGDTTSDGVFVIGKFQFQRDKTLTLLATDIENVELGANFEYQIGSTFDGKTFVKRTTPVKMPQEGLVARYQHKVDAKNHAQIFKGAFNLVSLQVTWMTGGDR